MNEYEVFLFVFGDYKRLKDLINKKINTITNENEREKIKAYIKQLFDDFEKELA